MAGNPASPRSISSKSATTYADPPFGPQATRYIAVRQCRSERLDHCMTVPTLTEK